MTGRTLTSVTPDYLVPRLGIGSSVDSIYILPATLDDFVQRVNLDNTFTDIFDLGSSFSGYSSQSFFAPVNDSPAVTEIYLSLRKGSGWHIGTVGLDGTVDISSDLKPSLIVSGYPRWIAYSYALDKIVFSLYQTFLPFTQRFWMYTIDTDFTNLTLVYSDIVDDGPNARIKSPSQDFWVIKGHTTTFTYSEVELLDRNDLTSSLFVVEPGIETSVPKTGFECGGTSLIYGDGVDHVSVDLSGTYQTVTPSAFATDSTQYGVDGTGITARLVDSTQYIDIYTCAGSVIPPLRMRQRDDMFNTPRTKGRGQGPSSLQHSLRASRGSNTYLSKKSDCGCKPKIPAV